MTNLRTDAQIIRSCIKLTIDFFDGDTDKASRWLNTENGLFANMTPLDFVSTQPERGEDAILNLIEGNKP